MLIRAVNQNLSNVVSYGAAISACEKNEEWKWALVLLSSLLAQSLEVNGVVFSALIDLVLLLEQLLLFRIREVDLTMTRRGIVTIIVATPFTAAGQVPPSVHVRKQACGSMG